MLTGEARMKYMVYTSLDGEIGTYDTEEEAMQAAQDYIDTDLDEINSYDDVTVYQVVAKLQVTEVDTKEKALSENRAWDNPCDVIAEAKMVKLEGATE